MEVVVSYFEWKLEDRSKPIENEEDIWTPQKPSLNDLPSPGDSPTKLRHENENVREKSSEIILQPSTTSFIFGGIL